MINYSRSYVIYLFCRNVPQGIDEKELMLNYGKTALGTTPKVLLFLTNKTAIATKFNVQVEHFSPARTPTPPSGK